MYNYDFPLDMEEYVHRVRRMGKTGTSISLWDKAEELINILVVAGQDVPDWLRRREAVRQVRDVHSIFKNC